MPDNPERSGRLPAHVLLWLVLTAFPVSFTASGDVNTAQIVLHGSMAALIGALVFVFGAKRPARFPGRGFAGAVVLVFLALGYFALLSSFNGQSGVVGDVVDVFRPLVYFLYFAFPWLMPLPEHELRRLLKFLIGLAVFQVLFSALVYLPPAWPVVNVFKGRTSEDSVVFHFFRWSGTHGYPSDFSFYLSFFFYLMFLARHRFLPTVRHVLLLLLFGLGIAMTMSRGGIASVAAMILVGAALFGRLRVVFALGAATVLLAGGLLLIEQRTEESFVNTSYVLDLIEQGTEAESAKHRVGEIELALEYGSRYFPFGLGAARDEIYSRIRVIESLYGHYFIKWGLLGFLLFTVSVVYLLNAAWNIWSRSEDLVIRYFGGAFFLLTLSVPMVFGFSSAISDRFKGLPFYYLLAGYAAHLYESRRTSRARVASSAPPQVTTAVNSS